MAALQVLEETFSAQGFHVLGFYSDDFGNQGGSDDDIDACTGEYEVTFPQYLRDHVIDPDGAGPEVMQPVWQWLSLQPNYVAPDWNFHKYLIDRDGNLIEHFPRSTWPGDNPNDPNDSFETSPVVIAIQALLAE